MGEAREEGASSPPPESESFPSEARTTVFAPPPSTPSALPPEMRGELPTIPPASTDAPVAQEVDEYAVLVPLVRTHERSALKLDAQSAMVLAHADGLTPIRAIVQRVPMSRDEVIAVAAELCARGLAMLTPLSVTPPPMQVKTSQIRLAVPPGLADRGDKASGDR